MVTTPTTSGTGSVAGAAGNVILDVKDLNVF